MAELTTAPDDPPLRRFIYVLLPKTYDELERWQRDGLIESDWQAKLTDGYLATLLEHHRNLLAAARAYGIGSLAAVK